MFEFINKFCRDLEQSMETSLKKKEQETDERLAFCQKVLDGDKEATEQFTKKLLEDMFPNS